MIQTNAPSAGPRANTDIARFASKMLLEGLEKAKSRYNIGAGVAAQRRPYPVAMADGRGDRRDG